MIRNYLFVCLFGISAYFIASSVAREAIVGGIRAEADQFKYQVSLQNHRQHICGGTIIGRKFILTAAHCVIGPNGHIKYFNLTILAGTNDLHRTSDPALIRQVDKIYTPTEFNPAAPAYASTADIAALEFSEELPLVHNRHLKAVTLPPNKLGNYENTRAIVSGFGWTWINVINVYKIDGGANDTRLRWAEAKVIGPNDPCYRNRTINADKTMCARVEQHAQQTRGVCKRDAGDPLVLQGTTIIIGILSIGPITCSERKHGATYTRITEYLTFIQNVKKNRMNKNIREYTIPNQLWASPSQASS